MLWISIFNNFRNIPKMNRMNENEPFLCSYEETKFSKPFFF
jgi:hypothetical protein